MNSVNATAIKVRDWGINFMTSSSKAHNAVLLLVAWTFYKVAVTSSEPMYVAAVGGVLATIYGANALAGTHANRTSAPVPPATPIKIVPAESEPV